MGILLENGCSSGGEQKAIVYNGLSVNSTC